MASIELLTIAAARAEIRARRMSCLELASVALQAIERRNSTLNALITARPAEAVLAEAKAADEAGVNGERPLHGIPVAIKDNYATAGLRTTAGSKVLEDWIPESDASVVRKLRQSGAILIGKANMHEFANGPTNDNPHWGRSLNPWNLHRTSGGSSGGSAVALAAGMCLGATGTDTGGSIRTPAAFCGVVGLKPTYGLVSRTGIVPFSPSLDHAGPMARSVRDVAILLGAMAGADTSDPASVRRRLPDYETALGVEIRGKVIGVETSYLTRVMTAGVRAAFERAMATFAELGTRVVEVSIPILAASLAAETGILFPEAVSLHDRLLERRAQDYGRDVRLSLLSGRLYTAVDYLNAQRVRSLIRQAVDAALDRVDVLAMPTVAMEPPEWGQDKFEIGDFEADVLNAYIRYTAPFNLTGHPALSIPCGVGDEGLPVGLQLVGKAFTEEALLGVGDAFERASEPLRPDLDVLSGQPATLA